MLKSNSNIKKWGNDMRLRHKPWAIPELNASAFYVKEPREQIGRWKSLFKNPQNPLYLELGCGKGTFISKMAVANDDINFLGIDIKSEVLGLTKRNIEREFKEAEKEPLNVLITIHDIERIFLMLSPDDVVDRIYINFCNPWPKHGDNKKRLTHTRQLEKYKAFLKKGAELWFKTDDDNLFSDSKKYLAECGFDIKFETLDLHASGFTDSISTEHEKMFTEMGIPTKFLIAEYR